MEKLIYFELDRYKLYISVVEDLLDSGLGKDDKVANCLRKNLVKKISELNIFEIFKNVYANNIEEYFFKSVQCNSILANEFLNVTIEDYLKLKATSGLERLGITDQYNNIHLGLSENDLLALVNIFSKMAFFDELNSSNNRISWN